jgi:hypothetical protein
MSKVIVSLYGGLGNQLFQYAVGRSISVKNNASLVLDIAWFEIVDSLKDTTSRKFMLSSFLIDYEIQTIGLPCQKNNLLKKLLSQFSFLSKLFAKNFFIYNEKSVLFDFDLLNQTGPLWLNGYWQSYKYFDSISEVIRKEIGTIRFLSVSSQKVLNGIVNCESICVHVRRGDYVSNANANKVHGLCGVEYYKKAIKLVAENLDNPVIYIFSDDPDWVRINLKNPYKTIVVDVNGTEDVCQDLWLMSSCKHFIIANSSLSWWVAWLSLSENKVVVAPKKWFANKSYDTSDLIPPDWIRI